jgi:hypothetical protein
VSGPEKVAELYLELEMRVAELEKGATRAEQTIDKLGAAAKRAKGDVAEVGEAGKTTGKELGEASEGAGKLGGEFGKLASGVAAGAAAAALGLVAARALEVAGAFDLATRQAAAASPALRRDLGGLQEGLRDAALETKRTLEEVSSLAVVISRQGVTGTEDLLRRVRASSELAKVTGESVESVASGLDQTLDVFALSETQIDEVSAKLFALAETGIPLNELFAVLQRAAPTLKDAGIGFDQAAAALAYMIDSGENAGQAAKRFRELASDGGEGLETIRQFALLANPAADGAERLAEALQLVEDASLESADAMQAKLSVALGLIGRGALDALGPFRSLANLILDVIIAGDKLEQRQREWVKNKFGFGGGGGSGGGVVPTSSPITATPPRIQVLPDIVTTETSNATRTAIRESQRDAEKATKALGAMRESLARVKAELMGLAPSPAIQAILDNAAKQRSALMGGSPEQRAEGEEIIRQTERYEIALVQIGRTLGDLEPRVKKSTIVVEDFGVEAKDTTGSINQLANALEDKQFQQALDDINEMADFAMGVYDVADAIIALGSATGALSGETAQALSGFVGLVASASSLSATLEAFKTLDSAGNAGASAGAVLSSAATVAFQAAGLISSLFAENPAIKAANDSLRENAIALRENTAGLLRVSASGSAQQGVRAAIDTVRGGRVDARIDQLLDIGGPAKGSAAKLVTGVLDSLGVSMDDLRQLAEELGLDFVDLTKDTVPQFLLFLDQMGIKLDEASVFGNDFAGALSRLNASFKVNGTDGPGQFAAFVKLLTDPATGAPAIFDALKGLDVSSPEGAAKARELLRGIFEDLDGFEKLDFGELSQSEAVDAILQLLGTLPDFPAKDLLTKAEQFALAVSAFNRAARVFDLTPIEQAERFLDILGDFAPELADAVSGFDLTTADGLAGAIAFLQDYFEQVEAGTVSLDGLGFTLDDLVSVIDMLQGVAADAADEVARLAREEADRAAQAERDAAQAEEDAKRAQERAAQLAEQAAQQAERDRVATGERGLRIAGDQASLFDISGNDLVKFRAAVFDQGSGGLLSSITGGADLGTGGGQAAALEALKTFFLANPNGTDAGVFGADAVRSQVLDLAELLKEQLAVSVTGGGANESFGFSRNITEAGADRLTGQLGTANLFLEDIRDILLERLTSPLSPVTLSTPALPAAIGAAGTNVGSIVLYLSVGGSTPVPGTLSAGTQNNLTELVRQIVRELNLQSAGG